MAVLYGNDAFSILVLSDKKRYSRFLKKFSVYVSAAVTYYHNNKVVVLRILLKSLYRIIIMSLTKYISKFFEKASKKRDLSDQSKNCEDPKRGGKKAVLEA